METTTEIIELIETRQKILFENWEDVLETFGKNHPEEKRVRSQYNELEILLRKIRGDFQ